MKPEQVIEQREIILLAGPGGVGKTTVSAATALQAARRGRRVLVVTIDPARRLADAMGIELGAEPVEVDLGPDAPRSGRLQAMMLDTKSAADELVCRFAATPALRDRVLQNRIYRTLSESLAGSQEYIAMGKLYEIIQRDEHDLVVIDTAPTRYALDFFEAPTRLADLLDARIMDRLLKPARLVSSAGFGALKRGSNMVIETLERVVGLKILSEISEFLLSVEGMFGGLRERAERMHTILKDRRRTAFVVVSSANLGAIREARDLASRVRQLGFPLAFMVINRVHPAFTLDRHADQRLQRFLSSPSERAAAAAAIESDGVFDGALLTKNLLDGLARARALASADRSRLRSVALRFQGRFPVVPIPFFEEEICDLDGLERLGRELFAGQKAGRGTSP